MDLMLADMVPDEAHFYDDGFVNKQNWGIRGTKNPPAFV